LHSPTGVATTTQEPPPWTPQKTQPSKQSAAAKQYVITSCYSEGSWQQTCQHHLVCHIQQNKKHGLIALNDDAQETCTLLVAALVEQGVPAESECGEGGNFAIYYMGDGFAATLAGFALPTSITGVVQ
jgi:hypothetical protein